MRRFFGLGLGVLILASCSEVQNSSPVDVVPEDDSTPPSSYQIYDGASGDPGANPHFYFLPPVAGNTPEIDGVADDNLEPIVDICYLVAVEGTEGEMACGDNLATFTVNDGLSVSPGAGYSAVWKTNEYNVIDEQAFRITVSLWLPADDPSLDDEQLVLGWADVKAYDNQTYSSFQHTDPQGFVAISDNGNLNIKFLIEEELLESRFCDPNSVEDCDVQLFSPDEAGCLQVFENPGTVGQEVLGSQACVPANGSPIVRDPIGGDKPVTGIYAVALTLEKSGAIQGGATPPVPGELQIPYFPDVTTYPSGIEFDRGSSGIQLTICQVHAYFEGQEDLLFDVQPFLIFTKVGADGTSTTTSYYIPQDYSIDPLACETEPFGDGLVASASGPEGFLGYLAAGVSRVSGFFLPKPLVARRLHGGLNTTVYSTKGDDSPGGEGENVAAFADGDPIPLAGDQYLVQGGGVLPPSAENSIATVPANGLQQTESSFTIKPLDGLGQPIAYNLFDVIVEWWVEGANQVGSALEPIQATGPDGSGLFSAAYIPINHGTDYIHITVNGEEISGSPFEHTVAPRKGDINVSIEISSGGVVAPELASGLPVKLYSKDEQGNLTFVEEGTAGSDGVATFSDKFFGSYVLYLPKRDFDVQFDEIELQFEHQSDPSDTTFTGTVTELPEGVYVYRIGAGLDGDAFGTGNAYQFVVDNRSWTSAQIQIRGVTLLGVPAHLVTIRSAGENAFVAARVAAQCPNVTDEKKCKSQGWIGLTDEETDGWFKWVDGVYLNEDAPSDPRPSNAWYRWKDGEPSGRNNEDHVEINLFGFWTDENGASSTNDGYLTEYDASQPGQHPPSYQPPTEPGS